MGSRGGGQALYEMGVFDAYHHHTVNFVFGNGGMGISNQFFFLTSNIFYSLYLQTTGAGLDYLNPGSLIPPSNNTYLKQLSGSGVQHQTINQSGASSLQEQQHQQHQQQHHEQQHHEQQQQQQQQPIRYTAAMMASTNAQGANNSLLNQSQASPILSSTNSQQFNQQFLAAQQQQTNSQNKTFNMGGITVMEPPSSSNIPVPQLGGVGGVVMGGNSNNRGGGHAMIGMNGDGLLYPIKQQQQYQQSQQQQLNQTVVTSNTASTIINIASGGRASAPPPQSTSQPPAHQFPLPPGGMTTMVMNNAAIRAYTASSLQMRVAELHQELGGNGEGSKGSQQRQQQPQQGGQGTTTVIQTVPAGAIPVVLTPNPTPPPHIVGPPSAQQGGPPGGRPLSRGGPSPIYTTHPGPQQFVTVQTIPQPLPLPMQMQPAVETAVDSEQQTRENNAVQELSLFLRDAKIEGNNSNSNNNSSGSSSNSGSKNISTRGLAILYASSLHVPDVRSTCEAFGALESFRSDFGESYGVYFATYYDLRSAQLAVGELPKVLNNKGQQQSANKKDGGSGRVQVKYCVPLNSSSAMDESLLMISKLPSTVDEQDLSQVLSSFGEVRAIHYQANMSDEDEEGNELTSYLVEFYDVQDARQALLELEQTNPWGNAVGVKVGSRSPAKRKQGKDLIMLTSRWRQDNNSAATTPTPQTTQTSGGDAVSGASTVSATPSPSPPAQPYQIETAASSQTERISHVDPHHEQQQYQQQSYYHQYPGQQQYQLVIGPDGQYQYALMPPQMVGHYGHPPPMVIDPQTGQQQHVMYAHDPYMQHHPHHMNPQQQYHIQYAANGVPQYAPAMPGMVQGDANQQSMPPTMIRMPSDVNSSSLSSGSQLSPGGTRLRGSHGTTVKSTASIGSGSSRNNSGSGSRQNCEDDSNNNLTLSIDNVRTGKDRRSSLMVRNIPNKYTQQMLLSEFAAAGHGSTKMDFFYLPIDFKNKCNRGYAFVNFVDYKDIIPFFDEYNSRGWKRFNSDKICDITYARIQGKAAMLKRFENSALMEKDDEYRPKVFVSHGERKGEIENLQYRGTDKSPLE